jgi:hypothetical protein
MQAPKPLHPVRDSRFGSDFGSNFGSVFLVLIPIPILTLIPVLIFGFDSDSVICFP